MREIIGLIGKSLAPGVVLREMLHLLSELLGLNRGRIVLVDAPDSTQPSPPGTSRIRQRRLTDDMALLKIMATLAGQVLQLQDLMQQQTQALETRNTLLTHALDAAAVRYGRCCEGGAASGDS